MTKLPRIAFPAECTLHFAPAAPGCAPRYVVRAHLADGRTLISPSFYTHAQASRFADISLSEGIELPA